MTTLSPKLVLTVCGTNEVRIPVLLCPTLCSVSIVVTVVTVLPDLDVFVLLFVSAEAFGHSAQDLVDSGLAYVRAMIGGLANG